MTKYFLLGLISFLSLLLAGCGVKTSIPEPLPNLATSPVNNSPKIDYLGTPAVVTLMEEKRVDLYLIRVWRDSIYHLDTITIEKDGSIKFQSAPWSRYEILDINSDGQPEIIIWQYGGGNHGTYQVQGFETDVNLTKILDTPPSMCEGEFKDINGDGISEYRTCDHTFVYYNSRCSYAYSPFVNAVFQYQFNEGYKLANLQFPQVYEEAISIHTKRIQDFQVDKSWNQETLAEETQCNILPLVLDYLYSGQPDKAWNVLDKYYQFRDASNFREDIEKKVHGSPFFVSQ